MSIGYIPTTLKPFSLGICKIGYNLLTFKGLRVTARAWYAAPNERTIMFISLIAALSLSVSPAPARDPEPEPCRMCVCNDTYDVCIADWIEDYEAGLLDGDEAIERYQSCTEWLMECQRLAELLDSIEGTVPILPGTIFPPGWDYEE